jgi:hypothetical protein
MLVCMTIGSAPLKGLLALPASPLRSGFPVLWEEVADYALDWSLRVAK